MSEDNNYVCYLDSKYVKKAKDELFEVPSDRLAAVKAFRDWIKEQKHIRCPQTDTLFMLTFLRWAKWSQVRARERLESFITMFKNVPSLRNMDPVEPVIMKVLKSGFLYVSPERTDKGELVIHFNMGSLSKVSCGMTEFIKVFVIVMMHVFPDELTQVNGVCFFLDYSKLGTTGMKKMLGGDQKLYKAIMSRIPGRWKNVIYYRAGAVFETLIAFFKPLMSKKLYERISTHDNMEAVYPMIPKRCFPVEYLPDDYEGPNSGTVKSLIDDTVSKLTEPKARQQIKYLTGDAFGIDEIKKSEEVMNTHFRKLNVD